MERYTFTEAKALGLTEFSCKYNCTLCSGRRRAIMNGKNVCLDCTRHGPVVSAGKLRANINKHNIRCEKMARQMWGIPVVFSGMNTGTR